jgi:hypothetical protein
LPHPKLPLHTCCHRNSPRKREVSVNHRFTLDSSWLPCLPMHIGSESSSSCRARIALGIGKDHHRPHKSQYPRGLLAWRFLPLQALSSLDTLPLVLEAVRPFDLHGFRNGILFYQLIRSCPEIYCMLSTHPPHRPRSDQAQTTSALR